MDTSKGAIPKRPRKNRVRAKLSFRSSASTGNGSLPCHRQVNLTDLVAHLVTTQKGEGDERQPDPTINANGEVGPTNATTISEHCEAEPVGSTKPLVEHSEIATSAVVDPQSCVGGDDQTVRVEQPESNGLTERDGLDILRQMRQILLKKSPPRKHGQVEAVRPFHAKLMFGAHGIMTAFLDTRPGCPGFIVVRKDYSYSFVYYEGP
ncbi:hypothetical protein HPB50_002471 [Hyalomma asiaticum]|uniref:Uncharacterized protein n=1 Tax=Hyalomma asiaticum TaxID=266040 RepID=A0ACB7RL32_HYAAI|nr:hypothetical protein HPB50_002471 [Hyalomma asiaticum]